MFRDQVIKEKLLLSKPNLLQLYDRNLLLEYNLIFQYAMHDVKNIVVK